MKSAPCCRNNTLAFYSLLLMANSKGAKSSSLEELGATAADPDARTGTFNTWIQQQAIDGNDHGILQLIISRKERMIGIGFQAKFLDRLWFPSAVRTYQQIWSQRYDVNELPFLIAFLIFLFIDLSHEVPEIFFRIFGSGKVFMLSHHDPRERNDVHKVDARTRFNEVLGSFMDFGMLYLILIELPTILMPVTLEMVRAAGAISVVEFNLLVSCTYAILLVRFFEEGKVISAFQLLILTMHKAAEQLVNLLLIMMITLAVATEMHVNIFGVFTSSYETYGEAFFYAFDTFAHGKNYQRSAEESNAKIGYVFLYLFSSIILMLVCPNRVNRHRRWSGGA